MEQLKNEIRMGITKGNIKTYTDLKATINAFYMGKYWCTNKIEYCKLQEHLDDITEDIMREMEIKF